MTPNWINVVRDPVERFASSFNYRKGKQLSGKLAIDEEHANVMRLTNLKHMKF